MRFARTAALALLCLSATAQESQEKVARADFAKRRVSVLVDAGQRHLEYGLELRKQGLTVQAAEQIRLAVEVSERQNPGANTVLGYMRMLDDAFWRKNTPRPTAAKLEAYVKRARRLEAEDQKDQLGLGSWALARGLEEEAGREYRRLLERRDRPLDFDSKGALVLEGGAIPARFAREIRAEAIEINGRLWLRDEFLRLVPDLKSIFECATDELRVRSTRSREEAERLHAVAVQLLPALAADLGAKPTGALPVVVVDARALYERWLDAAGLGEHKVMTGVAGGRLGAVVCSEGLDENALTGVVMHELTHLYDEATSRVALPSWYREGLAEVHGGPGTWSLQDGKLASGGTFDRARLAQLAAPGALVPLRDLVGSTAIDVWRGDAQKGRNFYAQSWALLTFLRNGAGKDVAQRMEAWETQIRGAMVGARIGDSQGPASGAKSAGDLFLEAFSKDLPKLEDAFVEWLRTVSAS